MKKLFFAFGLALVGLTATNSLKAQSADDALAKYYKAVGGLDAWKKVESIKMTGNFTLVANGGINLSFVATQSRPNLKRVDLEFNGTKVVDAYDGSTAWSINPFNGGATPTKKTADETKEAAKDMLEDDLIDYAAKGHKVELQGTEEVDGVKAVKIKLTRNTGDEKIYYLDPETYLTIMERTYVSTGPAKGQASESFMSDYKTVNGIMVPATTEVKINGQSQVIIKADKIEVNPKVDKDAFAFPAK